MTAKEKAIRKAYGEYWDQVKEFVNTDGWIYNNSTNFRLDNTGIQQEYDSYNLKFRPKSLGGIENNNGWIKIESEDDLPKLKPEEELLCFIKSLDDGRVGIGIYSFGMFKTVFRNEYNNVTHYQPIIKPKPPIY